MNRESDNWIVDALEDIEKAMISRNYNQSAERLALVRRQLTNEICNGHGANKFNKVSNVVRFFA